MTRHEVMAEIRIQVESRAVESRLVKLLLAEVDFTADVMDAIRRYSEGDKQALAGCGVSWLDELLSERDQLRKEVARLEHLRDAYKSAKVENDDRFMIERDEARAEADQLRSGRENLLRQIQALQGINRANEDAIASLRTRCELLEAALQPFARHRDDFPPYTSGDGATEVLVCSNGNTFEGPAAQAFWAAAELLKPTEAKPVPPDMPESKRCQRCGGSGWILISDGEESSTALQCEVRCMKCNAKPKTIFETRPEAKS